MRIILATEYFYPVSLGGTEMYVYQLAKEIIKNGHDCLVISVSDKEKNAQYENIQIKYISFENNLYNDTNAPSNLNYLLELIKDFKADVFHLHTYTPSIGKAHLLAIKNLGLKIFFTSHLPALTCLRGDLMFHGKEVCDGKMEKSKCMNCYLSTSNYNSITKYVFKTMFILDLFKSRFKALQVFDIKLDTLSTLHKILNKLIVVSEWQKQILLLNGIHKDEILVSRQAVFSDKYLEKKDFDFTSPLKIGFVGRIVNVKGLHILLKELNNLKYSSFKLYVAAIKAENEIEYYDKMKSDAGEINATWMENLNSNDIIEFLDNIDLLVIPSIMLETGPYTAFEALSRKVPILAFNYGGVEELITNNYNGFLVESNVELRDKINSIINNKSQLIEISNNINFKRDSNLIYEEVIPIYTT